jgi:hypothetical protein
MGKDSIMKYDYGQNKMKIWGRLRILTHIVIIRVHMKFNMNLINFLAYFSFDIGEGIIKCIITKM